MLIQAQEPGGDRIRLDVNSKLINRNSRQKFKWTAKEIIWNWIGQHFKEAANRACWEVVAIIQKVIKIQVNA